MTTSLILWIGVPVFAVILGYVYKTYNNLVKCRIDVDRQSSHVQVHLKKKFDLIPALASAVKGYAKHEKSTFEEVTKLRSQWGASKDLNEKMKTANQIEGMLSKLLVVQERYPNLKADRSFQNIMSNMSWVERELVHERKVYNKRVSWYNLKLQQVPSNIVAKIFGFKPRDFFGDSNEIE